MMSCGVQVARDSLNDLARVNIKSLLSQDTLQSR